MHDLRCQYEERLLPLHQLSETLHKRTSDALKDIPHVDRINFRVKETRSFLAKATPTEGSSRYESPLVEIEDQVAGRIIVFFTSDIANARDAILSIYRPVEVASRRPTRDDEFGYQSEHLILMIPPWAKPRTWNAIEEPPNTFELQLRTIFMHAYAEPQHNIKYKSAKELSAEVRRELAWIAASAWGADAAFARVRTALDRPSDSRAPTSA